MTISVISWKQAKTFFQCKKKLKTAKFSNKQQKRSFNWDIARISVISRKKAKNVVLVQKAKKTS